MTMQGDRSHDRDAAMTAAITHPATEHGPGVGMQRAACRRASTIPASACGITAARC